MRTSPVETELHRSRDSRVRPEGSRYLETQSTPEFCFQKRKTRRTPRNRLVPKLQCVHLRDWKAGGEYRNRTGVHGFAIRCVTTPPNSPLDAGIRGLSDRRQVRFAVNGPILAPARTCTCRCGTSCIPSGPAFEISRYPACASVGHTPSCAQTAPTARVKSHDLCIRCHVCEMVVIHISPLGDDQHMMRGMRGNIVKGKTVLCLCHLVAGDFNLAISWRKCFGRHRC